MEVLALPNNHQRRWASDAESHGRAASGGSSPATSTGSGWASSTDQEFVEVTLDLQYDNTVVLRSVEPATFIDIDGRDRDPVACGIDAPSTSRASAPVSPGPSMRRSASNKLLHFSQELKAEAVAKAKQFSHELKAELRRFSWSHGHATRVLSSPVSQNGNVGVSTACTTTGLDSALAARALRQQRARLDRTRSGAQKALQGLRFISCRKTNGVDPWNEVQSNFNSLSKNGYLYRSDFAQCIGLNPSSNSPTISTLHFFTITLIFLKLR